MPDIGSQRAAIATALAGVTGLRVDAEGLWPDRTNLPAAQIVPADTSSPMNLTMTAWDEAYDLTVLVSLAAATSSSTVFEKRYGRERWRSQSTIS